MAKILTTDEMLEALLLDKAPEFEHCKKMVEDAATAVARVLALHFEVEIGESGATFERLELYGTACSFYAKDAYQLIPKNLAHSEVGGDWEEKPKRA
jgi:hypothetical protein